MTQESYSYGLEKREACGQGQPSVAAPHSSSLGAFYLKNLLKFLLLLFILAVCIYAPRMVFGAANDTWSGGHASGATQFDWNTSQNWNNNAVPTSSDDLHSGPSAFTGITNNGTAGSARSLTFDSGGKPFTF